MSEQNTRTRESSTAGTASVATAKPKAATGVRTFIKTRRDQSSVIWGGPTLDKVIAKFSPKGICRTRSPETAERLLELGYQEVFKGQTIVPTPLAEPDMRFAVKYDNENEADFGEILEDVNG